ncbi:hypothetical protein DFH09DRAFT_1151267 [Mycena vulgaris]|nr:hypothetical protein DFH09DRAFT_1151267 [Mycena vulgaris]
MHWPHSVRFFVSDFCFCPRHLHEDPESCYCADREVRNVSLTVFEDVFKIIMGNTVPVDGHSSSWELFNNPLRLYTDDQNAQTMRFIHAYPAAKVRWTGRWANLDFKALTLSRYHFATEESTSEGIFVMILDGPTRGEIHAWSLSGETWYDGFEAESFWQWDYVEWDPYTVDLVPGRGFFSGEDEDEDEGDALQVPSASTDPEDI